MKRSNQQATNLALVPMVPMAAEQANSDMEEKSASLRDSFAGWLDAVAPTLLRETPPAKRTTCGDKRHRSLTARDLTRLNRATVRESSAHRHWPPEVIDSFLAAEVIRRK